MTKTVATAAAPAYSILRGGTLFAAESGKPSGVYRGDEGERRLFQLMVGSVERAAQVRGSWRLHRKSVEKRVWAGF